MSPRRTLIGAAFLSVLAGASSAQEREPYELYRRAPGFAWSFDHPTSRGPISTRALGLPAGEVRIQARYDTRDGDGLRDRTSSVSEDQAFSQFGYEYVPTSQRTDTMLLEIGYGVTEQVTLALEIPYLEKESDNVTSTGTPFRTNSEGIGDVELWVHNRWFQWGTEQAFWSAGLTAPTGSFDETDARPGSAAPAVLPYQMQLGSGTYDLTGMMSWLGYDGRWSWGGNILQTWRLFGPNDRRYTLGSYQEAALWGGRQLTESLVATARLQYSRQGDIKGEDPALSKARSPSEHPDQQKAKRIDIFAGLSFYQRSGLRIGIEAGIPLFQQLRGPQIQTDYFAGLALQWTF